MFKKIISGLIAAIALPIIANADNHKNDVFYGAVRVSHSWLGGSTDVSEQMFYGGLITGETSGSGKMNKTETNDFMFAIGKDFDLFYDDAQNSLLTLRAEFDWQHITEKYDMTSIIANIPKFEYFSGIGNFNLSMDSINIMGNAYVGYNVLDWLGLYVGAGFGLAQIDSSIIYNLPSGLYGDLISPFIAAEKSFYKPMYKLSVGIDLDIAYRTVIDFGYSYVALTSDLDFSVVNTDAGIIDKYSVNSYMHQITFGVRYHF